MGFRLAQRVVDVQITAPVHARIGGALGNTGAPSTRSHRYYGVHWMSAPVRPLLHIPSSRVLKWLLAAVIVIAVCLLWGGDLLIASDPLPDHVDAAIVLQG